VTSKIKVLFEEFVGEDIGIEHENSLSDSYRNENSTPNPDSTVACYVDNATYYRSLASFKNNPKGSFDFWTTEDESQVIDRLYSAKHITLQGSAKWALGIVTGNNEKHCSDWGARAIYQYTKAPTLRNPGSMSQQIL